MNTKSILLVVAILAMAIGASAKDPVLGGHEGHGQDGCLACHTPHNNGAKVDTTASITNGTSDGRGGTYSLSFGVTGTWTPAIQGQQINSQYYLWGKGLSPVTYTTWDGTTINASSIAGKGSALLHTIMCMSCHDVANSSYYMTTNQTGVGNTTITPDADKNWNGPALGDTAQGDLTTSHPVHAVYTSGGRNWAIDSTGKFTDTAFAYGHPAKLWVDSADSKAYVECTSCHNPHRRYSAVYSFNTTDGTVVTKTTENFIRGAYISGDEKADFCRSCHYSKTLEYWVAKGGNGGVMP